MMTFRVLWEHFYDLITGSAVVEGGPRINYSLFQGYISTKWKSYIIYYVYVYIYI